MTKPYDPDDPSLLVGTGVPGHFDTMAAGIVEEFVRMGLDDEALWKLFRAPTYQLTHAILRTRGEAYVQSLIDDVRARWGYPHFRKERVHDV